MRYRVLTPSSSALSVDWIVLWVQTRGRRELETGGRARCPLSLPRRESWLTNRTAPAFAPHLARPARPTPPRVPITAHARHRTA